MIIDLKGQSFEMLAKQVHINLILFVELACGLIDHGDVLLIKVDVVQQLFLIDEVADVGDGLVDQF